MAATLAPPALPSRGFRQRAKALDQYLRQIRSPDVVPGLASSMVAELRGDPWIHSQITTNSAIAVENSTALSELVAHVCALLAKCHADMGALGASPDLGRTTLYTLQAELMLDVAIGTALLREIQPAIDQSVGTGDLGRAKGLTQLGHRLRKGIASAREVLSYAGRSDAEQLADAMTEQPREETQGTGLLDQAAREVVEQLEQAKCKIKRRLPTVSQVRLPTRTELLVATLACTLLLWAGLVQLPQYLDKGPRLITIEDFTGTSVQEVVTRPPSLFVTLDAVTWDSTDAAARESMLAKVVSVPLVDEDYRGALFKTSDGRPVATWMRDSGIRVLEIVEPIAPPGAAKKATIFVP